MVCFVDRSAKAALVVSVVGGGCVRILTLLDSRDNVVLYIVLYCTCCICYDYMHCTAHVQGII